MCFQGKLMCRKSSLECPLVVKAGHWILDITFMSFSFYGFPLFECGGSFWRIAQNT